MLRLEDWMSLHGSLFAVIQGKRGGQSICYKSPGVCVYARQASVVYVCAFLRGQTEPGSEIRSFETVKRAFDFGWNSVLREAVDMRFFQ